MASLHRSMHAWPGGSPRHKSTVRTPNCKVPGGIICQFEVCVPELCGAALSYSLGSISEAA